MSDHAELARRNGARSKGPKTHAGRARAAQNALRHGLRAAAIVFPGLEDVREWEHHLAEIVSAWQPRSYLEELLVERVAVQTWRLRRVARIEGAVAATGMYRLNFLDRDEAEETAGREARAREDVELETRVMAHRTAAVPGEWMETLSRYETSIERSLFRTLAALRAERENAPLEGALVEETPSAH
jgi:hypothetical protein